METKVFSVKYRIMNQHFTNKQLRVWRVEVSKETIILEYTMYVLEKTNKYKKIRLPEEAQDFVYIFDNVYPADPFSFEIELGE